MELIIDAGNSNVVLALYGRDQWIWVDRIETKTERDVIFLHALYSDLLIEHGIPAEAISMISLSCVVSEMLDTLINSIESYFGIDPIVLSPELFVSFSMQIPKPYEIGSDLVANAFAALQQVKDPCIIVDFGTALTFTVVTPENGIEGVTIAPGLETAIQSLSSQTSKLPVVPLAFPTSVIGKNTPTAIQAGVMYGYIGLVKEILERIKTEQSRSFKVIGTGGLSQVMKPLHSIFDIIDPYLTLEGIRLIGLKSIGR